MSTRLSQYKDAYKPSDNISKQLDNLLSEIQVRDLREVHDLSDDDLDILLNSIKIESTSTKTLMDLVNTIVRRDNITSPEDVYNTKVKVLLDNLAKKMCRCSPAISYEPEGRKIATCRKTIFQKRDIDFFTYECEPAPILKPKKGSKKILRKYQPAGEK